MKSYDEQRYPVAIQVRVSYPSDTWIDGIKGLNAGHALYLARQNWPGATITIINDATLVTQYGEPTEYIFIIKENEEKI